MVTRPKILDDIAGMAGGAFSALSGLGEEIEQLVRARVDEALVRLRLVRRDEFDAVSELAANVRAGHEDALVRLAALEARVDALDRLTMVDPVAETAPDSPGGAADPHLHDEGGVGGPPPLQ